MGHLEEEKRKVFNLIFGVITASHILLLIQTVSLSRPAALSHDQNPIAIKLAPEVGHRKQIVRSSESSDKRFQKDAFLSDKTRSFDRQTKARRVRSFSSGREGEAIDLSQLGSAENPFKVAANSYVQKKKGKKQSSAQEVSSTNDHLPDILPGDLTQLNTVEFKYYGFYHRIRQKLEQFWGRSIHQKAQELAKAGRQIASSDEFTTALRVTLDQEGRIVGIEIVGASGVKELDDAAIEAFNEAGPFPNPPKDLVINGKVTIEWGFIVNS
jgi:TonB family protein